ncbi:sensor histidine kinase [Hymenobacter sp. B81]|uniref:sensor histidine kinase n=1 Tax=Hymenobacter sp. B81 TaxID=3344878 RepID=UPI0037DC6AFF
MDKPAEITFAWLLFGGVGVMLLLATATVLILVLFQRRAQGQQLRLQQLTLEHQQQMLQAVVASQESERARITRDLHDEIGASLSVAKLFVGQIGYEAASPDVAKLAGQATDILAETVRNIREIVHNLSPATLHQLGLRRTLSTQLDRLAATGLRVEAHVDPAVDALSEAHQLALYRIVQEALGNALKHAQARQLSLRLERQPGALLLEVHDDGRGFNSARPAAAPGLGLGGMQARAQLLGGRLQVHSAPGAGTRVQLHLPL